jgi:DNA primase catalytic core
LRSHLALLAVDGTNPIDLVRAVAGPEARELDTALDPAAVIDWRLDPDGSQTRTNGPLPWLPAVPAALADHPHWGRYLTARASRVAELAADLRGQAEHWTPVTVPMWATRLLAPAHDQLRCDLAVWRAATGIAASDRHPTGGPQLAAAAVRYQGDLDQRAKSVLGDPQQAAAAWAPLVNRIDERITADDYWPELADRLAAIDRAGIDVRGMLSAVAAEHSLPDEQPAAALWWRLSRHLSPAATAATAGSGASTLRPAWTPVLVERLGADRTQRVTDDPAWPALVAAVNAAPRDEWTPEHLLATAIDLTHTGATSADTEVPDADLAAALVWRVAMLTDPAPLDHEAAPLDPAEAELAPPADLHLLPRPIDVDNSATPADLAAAALDPDDIAPTDPLNAPDTGWDDQPIDTAPSTGVKLERAMYAAAVLRSSLEPTEAELWAGVDEQLKWRDAAVPKARLIELNQQAADYYSRNYPRSWAATYLRARLGTDLIGDDRFTPGYAPASWTSLTNHLRRHGAFDQEILAAGLARIASTGRLIDQFRDRLMFPIHGPDGHIHGFIGRRNPAHDNDDGTAAKAGPKYLNTPETDLFDKGAQLFGLHEGRAALAAGAAPVLVEGPIDALAVTLGADGTHVGAAPLGTAFTDKQANHLIAYIGPGRPGVLVATDADNAGWKAAQRAHWQLTARGDNPGHVLMNDGFDPAQILEHGGPAAIQQLLAEHQPLARTLIDDRISAAGDGLHTAVAHARAIHATAEVIGALPPHHWIDHIAYATDRLEAAPGAVHLAVIDAGQAWTHDPRGLAQRRISAIRDAAQPRALSHVAPRQSPGRVPQPLPPMLPEPADRWADLVARISPALIDAAEWPNLAHAIDRAHAAGYDVAEQLPRLAAEKPLSQKRPARELQYRLIDAVPAAAAAPTQTSDQADRVATDDAARRKLAEHPDDPSSATETRTEDADSAEQHRPEDRWRALIGTIHADILTEDGWSALAATLDTAAAHGLNVEQELPHIATAAGPLPARNAAAELRYRVLAEPDLNRSTTLPSHSDSTPQHQDPRQPPPPPSTPDPARTTAPRR